MRLLLLVLLLLAPPAHAADEAVTDVTFADDLLRPYDIKLQGLAPSQWIHFALPQAWMLTADPELHLDLSHSETLLAGRSTLTIRLNGSPVGSASLNADNVRDHTLIVALPRANLHEHNSLEFQVAQHIADDVEDPFDPSLWTRVGHTSFLRFRYRNRFVQGDLTRWPFPLFDPQGYGPLALTLVGPSDVSDTTVGSLARIGITLGRIADYRGVALHPPVATAAEARTPALLLGTLAEIPEIARLVDVSALADDAGLVAVVPNPADPSLPVLVVTGASDLALERAVAALTSGDGPGREGATPGPVLRNGRSPRPVLGQTVFTAADVGVADTTVRGLHSPVVRIPIGLEGDARPLRTGGLATIRYGYGAMLDTEISSAEIRLNGVTIDSFPLDDPAGGEQLAHRLALPSHILTPDSYVEVAFNLFPADYDIRHTNHDRGIWATVYADSSFEIPRDRYADVPDLGRLRFDAWPFTLEPGRGATTVVLPDRPTRTEAAAALELAAYLGYASVSATPDLRVAAHDTPGRHRILLVDDRPHPLHEALARRGLAGTEGTRIEERIDPDDASRVLLTLKAPSPGGLLTLVDHLGDPSRVVHLDGDTALVDGRDVVRTSATFPKVRLGSPSLTGRVQGIPWDDHWLLLGSALLVLLSLSAATVRAWARSAGGEVV